MALIHELIAGNQIRVVLQPIVDLTHRKIFAYESLVRSTSPDMPGALAIVQAAVAAGVMGELGRKVRQLSLTACPADALSLNVHPSEFDSPWLVRPDDPIFSHDNQVYLEILESVPLSHYRLCHTILREVRSRGVRLAVDDFGAGYSNLKYIADLTPEIVKVDRGLIAGLTRESRMQRLLSAIVRMCEDLGAKVVAEGIETPDELAAVRESGVYLAQGYLLARPAFPPPQVNWAHVIGPPGL